MSWTSAPIRRACFLTLLTLSLGALPVEVGAWDLGGVTGATVIDSTAQSAYARVTVGAEVPEQPQSVALVELLLQADLLPGEEVELWVVSAEAGLPWAEGEEDVSRSDRWVGDEATGTLIRFDVTAHVRGAWLAETPVPVFLIRRGPDDEDDWESLDLLESPDFRLKVHGGD